MANLETILKQSVLEATKKVEEQLDAEIERLDNLELDDLKTLREKRLKELKKEKEERREWLAMGHGEYTELAEEKQIFEISKKSHDLVLVLYKKGSPRCGILDHHMKILCLEHLETRFLKIDVERAPFLTDRLGIRIIPTVLLVKDGKTVDRIVGFTELGNCDDFSTEMLEWRIARNGIIRYSGDLTVPPDKQKIRKPTVFKDKKRSIREKYETDSSGDEFFND